MLRVYRKEENEKNDEEVSTPSSELHISSFSFEE